MHVFCLVMISLLKLLGLKIYFHSPSEVGQVLFLNLKLIVKAKRRKLILHMILLKAFIFEHGLNLKLFFLKPKARVMKLICYMIENINMRLKKIVKYLVPIIDTIVILAGFYPSTFVYSQFCSKIHFLYCLLSSLPLWGAPIMLGTKEKIFDLQIARNALLTLFIHSFFLTLIFLGILEF